MQQNRIDSLLKVPLSVHIVIMQDGKVLLQKRHNTGFADGMYALPSGCVEANESIYAAAKREAKEELGITFIGKDIEFVTTVYKNEQKEIQSWNSVCYFLSLKNYQGEIINMEPDKCSELSFYSLDSLPENFLEVSKKGLLSVLSKEPFLDFAFV